MRPPSIETALRTRALVALLATATLLLPATAAAADDDRLADPAYAAASWLTSELGEDGLIEGFGTVSTTLDAILALTITDVGGASADAALAAIEPLVDEYVTEAGAGVNGGRAAKALLAVNARGGDVTSFGGRDLEADLRGSVQPDGSISATLFAHAVGVSALTTVATDPTDADLVAASGYLADQCDATGCPGDADTDGFALVAFLDADSALGGGYADDATEIADALEAEQAADGSFSSFGTANSNTTGIAGWALRLAGRDAAADQAAGFVASLQLGTDLPADDVGAIAYAATGFGSVESATANAGIPAAERISFQGATAQGVLALAGASTEGYAGADGGDDAPGAPAAASPAGACPDDTGITLVVDPIDLGDGSLEPRATCVAPFDGMDGLDLLLAAGFGVASEGGALCQIDGRPADVTPACFGSDSDPNGYWASWLGTRDSVAWEFAPVGPADDTPVAGDVRGWSWEDDFSDDDQRLPRLAPATSGIAVTITAADGSDSQEVADGAAAAFAVTVASTGSADLTAVTVTTDADDDCDRALDDLTEEAPSVTFTCTGEVDRGTVTASVTATALGGQADGLTAQDGTEVVAAPPAEEPTSDPSAPDDPSDEPSEAVPSDAPSVLGVDAEADEGGDGDGGVAADELARTGGPTMLLLLAGIGLLGLGATVVRRTAPR